MLKSAHQIIPQWDPSAQKLPAFLPAVRYLTILAPKRKSGSGTMKLLHDVIDITADLCYDVINSNRGLAQLGGKDHLWIQKILEENLILHKKSFP